ncbi:MAG: response regulator transcription factor [Myxococcales bacterium]
MAQVCAAADRYRAAREGGRAAKAAAEALRALCPHPLQGAAVEAVISAFDESRPAELPRGVVLIADPDAEAAERLALRLANDGLRAEVVRDGEAAIARMAAGDVGLIVAELLLPGRDGLGLCVTLGSQVPVILWTSRAGPSDAARALKLGATDVIAKDADDELLVAKIERYLREWPQ